MKIAMFFYLAFQFCFAKRQILFPRSEFFRSKLCPGLSPDLDCGKFNVSSMWQFQGINLRRCDDFHWCKIRAIQEVSANSLAWKNQTKKIQRSFQANEKAIESSRSDILQSRICYSLWNHKFEWSNSHKCFSNPESLLSSKK